jgi:Protein of unknown function (DUF1552)
MRMLNRRQFAYGVGGGLLLAPFASMLLQRRPLGAASTKRAKRLLLFCSMGTKPELWSPTAVSAENSFTFSAATAPLAAHKNSIVLVEGLPSGNPNDGHGAPDGITGMGYGGYNDGKVLRSVDQFVADGLVAAGINRPIASLLLGSETAGGTTLFYRGNNLLPIASPTSAYNTVFGAVVPMGTAPATLLRRRRSVLDLITGEAQALRARSGTIERAKLDLHLDSIRQLENKLIQSGMSGGACRELGSVTDSTSAHPGIANDLLHLDIIVNAFACDVTRVAAIQFGQDGKFEVDLPGLQGDQHTSFIHGSSTDFTNLTKFEIWMAQQFAGLITKLKARPEPDDPSTSLYDNTLMVWCRDMGDSTVHNQKSMRFVLAGGAGGYLKTDPNGRYLDLRPMGMTLANRHERVLLSICDAMGITSYAGFGDPTLTAPNKSPLPGLAA